MLFCAHSSWVPFSQSFFLSNLNMLHTGVKPSADASMPQAHPSGEDTVQAAPGLSHDEAGKEEGSLAMDTKNTQEGTDGIKSEEDVDQGPPEAGDATNCVGMPDEQLAKPELSSVGADFAVSTATGLVEPASKLRTQAAAHPDATVQAAEPLIPVEAADQSLPAGIKSVALSTAAEAETHGDAASQNDVSVQNDVAEPMDQDRT